MRRTIVVFITVLTLLAGAGCDEEQLEKATSAQLYRAVQEQQRLIQSQARSIQMLGLAVVMLGGGLALALAYFELMAACAGLGTVWCGLAKMTLELLPELKTDLGLAPGHYYTMLFGVPAVRYARTVQRDDDSHIHYMQV